MLKRLLLIVALGAAFAACSPAGGSSSPDVVSPTLDVAPSDVAPSMEASPS